MLLLSYELHGTEVDERQGVASQTPLVSFFGAASALTAECRISGTYPDDPAVENLLYNVG